jgi:hypothetical protein
LTRGTWEGFWFPEVVRAVTKVGRTMEIVVVGLMRWSKTVDMKGKGSYFRVKGLLLILKENFMAQQFRLEVMKGGFTVTQSKSSNKRVVDRINTINSIGDEIIIFNRFSHG